MMAAVEKSVNDIHLLMQSGDLSDTPELRTVHRNYLKAFEALKNDLAQCRVLVNNGSLQEARQLNCSFEPSLTRQAELLDFAEAREFLDICREYGLPMPDYPDEGLLNLLSAPASSGEKHLHALLQDYRKIARSGTLPERIALLRKIVTKLPESARWRNDLQSAERGRLQEIVRQLEKLPQTAENQELLESFYRELLSPEWTVPVKPELLQTLRERLRPLQQAALKQSAEERLRQMQEYCVEQDISRLRAAFEEWRLFSGNPLLQLTDAQQQEAKDIGNFLSAQEKILEEENQYQELVSRIEQKLSENAPYAELAGDHNKLQLLAEERSVSPGLLGQLETLCAESRLHEHLRNIRRTIYGVLLALLAVGLLFGVFHYQQHRSAVRQVCNDMEKQLAAGNYREVQDIFQSLKKSSPRLAEDARIRAICRTALQEQEQKETLQKQRQMEFAGLLRQLKRLAKLEDSLDNADMTDRLLAEAHKLLADQPQTVQETFRELETDITGNRTARKKNREKDFITFCRQAEERLKHGISGIAKLDIAELSLLGARVLQEFDAKVRTTPYIPAELKNQKRQNLEKLQKQLSAALAREKIRRQIVAPQDFISYATGLETCRYQDPVLAGTYRKALEKLEFWRSVFTSYQQGNIPASLEQLTPAEFENCRGLLQKDMAQIMPAAKRSPEFNRFFTELQNLGALKELHFVSAKGDEYYFYTAKELIWERLSHPRRIHLSFYSIEKEDFFTFRYDFGKQSEPIRSLNFPRKLSYKLPEKVSLAGADKSFTRENVAPVWPGYLLTEKFSALAADGPGVCANLQAALEWLTADGNVTNAYLKEVLVLRFLEEFCRVWPLSSEAALAAGELRQFHQQRSRNWRAPQEFAGYAAEKKQLQTLWHKVDFKRFEAAARLRADFVCAFHARRLMPAAVVSSDGIHRFQKNAPAELLVLDENRVTILSNGVWQNKPAQRDQEHLFPGQILWTFEDNRTSRDFVKEWSDKATRLNIRLGIKPAICPEGVGI